MSMDQLPRELIKLILQRLDPVDRLRSSLTCRKWAEDVSSSSSLKDIWRVIYGSDTETVIKSQRQYRNIRIFGANLSEYNVEFWEKVGRHLRCLELLNCDFTPEVFESITRHCPQLKSLELKAEEMYLEESVFRKEIFSDRCAYKSGNVQHLATGSYMTEEIIEHLLTSMPQTTSFSLRFHDSLHCLPCILKARHTFTELEIFAVRLSDAHVLALVRKYSGSLKVLRLYCDRLTNAAYSALGDCTRLRHLTLIKALEFGDCHLEKVVRNAPELETLDFDLCHAVTDVGLAHIHNLKGLRNLGLRGFPNLTINAVRRAGGIPTLRHLHLDCLKIDITVIRNMLSLKDLRALWLCVGVIVNSEGFDIICSNLVLLEELTLRSCMELKDADGVKLRRLTRLNRLFLGSCFQLTDLTFKNGLGSAAMEYLALLGCSLSRAGLAGLAVHHGRLRKLQLACCNKITDGGLAMLLRREPFLEELRVYWCRSLTDWCLRDFGNSCPRLRELKFQACHLSSEAQELFKRRRPLVRVRFV